MSQQDKSWVEKLWENNKILFFLLLPITLVALFYKFYMDYNMMMAEKELKETQSKDDKLKAEQDELNNKANEHLNKANESAQKVKDRENEEVDLEWHKKK